MQIHSHVIWHPQRMHPFLHVNSFKFCPKMLSIQDLAVLGIDITGDVIAHEHTPTDTEPFSNEISEIFYLFTAFFLDFYKLYS